jgi:hypothetical protein
MDRYTLIMLAIILTRAVERAFREDINWCKDIRDPWRNLIVGGSNLIFLPVLDALLNRAAFWPAMSTGLFAFLPSLVSALLSLTKNPMVSSAMRCAAQLTKKALRSVAAAVPLLLLAGFGLSACHFEEARLAGVGQRTISANVAAGRSAEETRAAVVASMLAAAPSEYCVSLDSRQLWLHAAAAGAGVLAASTGIPALVLPDSDRDVRLAVSAVALGMSAAGAILVMLAEGTATTWVRDCAEGAK